MNVNVRPLAASEWQLFRDFRLHALKSAPGMFETTYDQAAARSEDDWRALLAPERQQIFGVFDGDQLIGLTAVFTSRDDPATAMLAMHFIRADYRGRRLSRFLYEAPLDWARRRKTFRRVIVAARESNFASLAAMRAAGFKPVRREGHTWPDGATEDEIWHELMLAG